MAKLIPAQVAMFFFSSLCLPALPAGQASKGPWARNKGAQQTGLLAFK